MPVTDRVSYRERANQIVPDVLNADAQARLRRLLGSREVYDVGVVPIGNSCCLRTKKSGPCGAAQYCVYFSSPIKPAGIVPVKASGLVMCADQGRE